MYSSSYTEAYRQPRGSPVSLERRKILFVVNDAGFFKSHRLRLAQEALCRGYEPVVVCGAATGEEALGDFGIRCRSFDLSRSGLNPLRDLNTVLVLLRIYRQEAPDIVHHVTIKPVIYGTLASRFAARTGRRQCDSGNGVRIHSARFYRSRHPQPRESVVPNRIES